MNERHLNHREKEKDNVDPYEVNREKPGYTHTTGPTLILGDESCAGLRLGLSELGAGRCFISARKEVAETGQTTVGFIEKIRKSVGMFMRSQSNAIIQIGKHDILGTSDSAEQIYARMQEIWAMLDKYNMKIHACTIPIIENATKEQEHRRQQLNKLIRGTDAVFNVIDLETAVAKVDTTAEDLVIDGKRRKETPKTEKDKLAVAYLEALIGGGRDSFKEEIDPSFAGPPAKVAYTLVSDSYGKEVERDLGGAKKSLGHTTSSFDSERPMDPTGLPKEPGANTAKMARELETQVIPSLTKQPGYRCAVIQAGAEDILAPLPSDTAMDDAEKAIIKNLKQMYRRCLESNPPVMVVAVTLPPMSEHCDKHFQEEERERHYALWRRINDFIIKETFRLSQHPKDRYKRVMCVRAHDMIGTRNGYVKEKYKGEGGLNERGRKQMAMQIHKAINQMQVGVDYGRNVFGQRWKGPDYFLDENNWK